jgi:hypothetical protein
MVTLDFPASPVMARDFRFVFSSSLRFFLCSKFVLDIHYAVRASELCGVFIFQQVGLSINRVVCLTGKFSIGRVLEVLLKSHYIEAISTFIRDERIPFVHKNTMNHIINLAKGVSQFLHWKGLFSVLVNKIRGSGKLLQRRSHL